MEVLKQNRYQPLEDWQQALLLFAVSEDFAKDIPIDRMDSYEKGLFPYFETEHADLVSKLRTGAKADGKLLDSMRAALRDYKGE